MDEKRLEELALAYVARFATSTGRLAAYCRRKLRERGHVGAEDGASAPDIESLVAKFAAKGFVDDETFAQAKTGGLLARGFGARRIGETLRADGIAQAIQEDLAPTEAAKRASVAAFARRRRLGPFARDRGEPRDPRVADKQLAALLRAGHDHTHARFVLVAQSEDAIEAWIAEAAKEEEDDG